MPVPAEKREEKRGERSDTEQIIFAQMTGRQTSLPVRFTLEITRIVTHQRTRNYFNLIIAIASSVSLSMTIAGSLRPVQCKILYDEDEPLRTIQGLRK